MRSHQTFVMSYRRILLLMLSLCMALAPLHSCIGEVDGANRQKAKTAQDKATGRLTRLDLSRLTFNDDISYLSAAEQEQYRKCQAEFFASLKHLPQRKQKELKEAYKWVPDVVKVIASRDYQDRKEYIQRFKPSERFYSDIAGKLYERRKQISRSIEIYHVIRACERMIQFRYPVEMIDTKNQSIDDTAKKCGFGNLAKMVDFCNNPANQGKFYNKSVDKSTYNQTMEEMDVFIQNIGFKYEREIWADFKRYPKYCVPKFWKFDLKKADTSNLTPVEYTKMEQQLKCVPPEILVDCRYKTYDGRMGNSVSTRILKDTTYIKKYAQNKGIRLSESEAQEVYQLSWELIKYRTPLKLVKRDEQADLEIIAKDFGFPRVWGFYAYHKTKMESKTNFQFYEKTPEKIPYFIAQAKDFYDLGMAVNPEGTKKLYQNIESDTGIVIQHQGAALDASKGHHVDDPQNKGEEVPSGSGVHKATSLR